MSRMAFQQLLISAATWCLVAGACTTAPRHAPASYAVVELGGAVEKAAARYGGAPCELPPEIAGNINGAPDPDACGPFPCAHGGCFVQPCSSHQDCTAGFCSSGYCLVARPHGKRACGPLTGGEIGPASAGKPAHTQYAERAGCSCVPDGSRARDPMACGSFPCSPAGCYVNRCSSDDDCSHGLCSSHASSPQGYCVTDDPH